MQFVFVAILHEDKNSLWVITLTLAPNKSWLTMFRMRNIVHPIVLKNKKFVTSKQCCQLCPFFVKVFNTARKYLQVYLKLEGIRWNNTYDEDTFLS